MENNKIVVAGNEMEIIDGKVVIESEDLAAAIRSQEVNLNAEEEAEGIFIIIKGAGC